MGLLFNGYRVPVWDDDKDLQMDKGDGCIIWMYLTCMYTELHTQKWLR